jgi:FG-GAP-like repeat/Salmonella virulence plasmid 65kDa B protein/Insecticide toxin TcdB middle/N-terminal region
MSFAQLRAQCCHGCMAWRGYSLWVLDFALLFGAGSALAQVSVSSSGSPSYSHPIAVPPGISGMQPNLSLMYAGGGVNGPVGHGWSVQGISMITRCPATRFTDGAPRGVKFDKDDKLCLDGQRLIQTDANGAATPAAVYDVNGKLTSFPQVDDARGLASGWREYRTEKDSFARIRAYGIANTSDVNGPAHFKVWTKAGQVYEYGLGGNVPDAANAAIAAQGKSVVMVWTVGRISDVVGNYIDFKYEVRDVAWGSGPTAGAPTPGREWNLAEVQYTGNGNQVPTNKVIFRYSDRTVDKAEAYQQGSKNVSIRRLDAIETYINSPSNTNAVGTGALLVKRTKLAYDNSGATKRSRLVSIKECSDAAEAKCLPPTSFSYAAGGSEAFSVNTNFNLTTTQLMRNTGTMGVIPIDYNGDGRTDLLRWSDTPSENQLWRSNGNGSFTLVSAFNVTAQALFSSNQCYVTQFADFNGDGLPDVLRTMKSYSPSSGASCGTAAHLLFINSGDGTFTSIDMTSSGISFAQQKSTRIDRFNCLLPFSQGYVANCSEPGDTYLGSTQSAGANFYAMDVNLDGHTDIVTTVLPAFGLTTQPPTEQQQCAATICTKIYLGSSSGAFTPLTNTNIANRSVYAEPAGRWSRPQPVVADINGDGNTDLSVRNGGWLSRGDGNFDLLPLGSSGTCLDPIDFNGDGRSDCLIALSFGAITYNQLRASDGGVGGIYVASFNLNSSGFELAGTGAGVEVADLNGDGRTDILRWKDDPLQNKVYLSNGDGSFTASTTFNLWASTNLLQHSNGDTSFTLGDFLGNGSVQILRLKGSPAAGAATANQLYVKTDPTSPDQLISVVSPTGLKTNLIYDSLANASSGRYTNDRGTSNAATYPLVDLTVASPVVVTMEADVGVGANKVQTQFAYKGLKAAVDGRGMLGFRQSIQSNKAPNGEDLSIFTDYLLDEPYAGVARRTETRRGAWNAPNATLLSITTNTYCDRTSATNPDSATETAPCATNARIRRPYLRRSVEQGNDLDGSVLPTVTTVNTYNDFGDPTDIVVTTTGNVAGLSNQQYIKTTANTFCAPDTANCPNKTSGDQWILGRLTKSTVANKAPNLLANIGASPGIAANATATSGNQNVSVPISPATLAAILQLLLDD